jgi:hypothetical protein
MGANFPTEHVATALQGVQNIGTRHGDRLELSGPLAASQELHILTF